jgi:hypothetical protein
VPGRPATCLPQTPNCSAPASNPRPPVVPCITYGPHAAALTVALAVLAASLRRQPGLLSLRLRVGVAGYASVLRQGGAGAAALPRLWAPVLAALRASLCALPSLRLLSLAAPPGVLPPGPLQRLAEALAAAPGAARAAVLAGAHARGGAGSPLRGLPREVLGGILDLAAPKVPPRLEVALVDPFHLPEPGGSGSSDSSSSSDGSDSDSSSGDSEGDSDSSSESESGGPGDVAVAAAAAAL